MWGNRGPEDRLRPPCAPLTCPEECALERFKRYLFHCPPAFGGGVICRCVCKIGAPTFRVVCSLICAVGATGIRHVQEQLGHRCPSTTALYTRVAIEDLRQLIARARPRR